MHIITISDLHGDFYKLNIPEADVLIIAGDLTTYGTSDELVKFNKWLYKLPCKYKLIIAGNHDRCMQEKPIEKIRNILSNGTYLENSGIEIDGVKFWGSPNTPIFGRWYFMQTGDELKETRNKIPEDTNVLISHGPCYSILDSLLMANGTKGQNVGCVHLRDRIEKLKIKLSVCGHIHNQYGTYVTKDTTHINASVMDENYNVVNKPIEIWYYKDENEVIV